MTLTFDLPAGFVEIAHAARSPAGVVGTERSELDSRQAARRVRPAGTALLFYVLLRFALGLLRSYVTAGGSFKLLGEAQSAWLPGMATGIA